MSASPAVHAARDARSMALHNRVSVEPCRALQSLRKLSLSYTSLPHTLGPEPEFRDHGYFFMPISSQLFLWGMFGDAQEASGLASPRIEWDSDESDRQTQGMYDKSSRFIYSASELELKRILGQRN